jgi:tRNA1Val (adenine37-N6)-methyltransferase
MASPLFRFKRFGIEQHEVTQRVGTDGVLLGAWAPVAHRPTRILDIGTGTGLIALFVAQRTEHFPVEKIVGVDIHLPSVQCARRNFQASPWAAQLSAVHAAIQDFSPEDDVQFDLIVSNPPFFTAGIPAPRDERRLSRMAEYLHPETLVLAVKRLLQLRGLFCTILPPVEGQRLCELAACHGLYCTKITTVFPRPGKPVERLLLQFETRPFAFERSAITIYDQPGFYSEAFRTLTHAFYVGH